MKDKVKILFVVSEFWQAGTQRFTFELDRALDKKRFDVSILSILPLTTNEYFGDYYYDKHLALGSTIYFLQDVDILIKPTLKQRIYRKFFGKSLPNEHQSLINFLESYDVISVMGEYNYLKINKFLSDEIRKCTFIHIMNSKFQSNAIYDQFPKSDSYHFISGFREKQISWELAEFNNFKHTYFNLNFKLEKQYAKGDYKKSDTPKIGIFTRLTFTKPLDPFIEAFKSLRSKLPNAELHIYGGGDPSKEGVLSYVEKLSLESSVFFRGHQNHILKTAIEDNIDLVWFHGYHGMPGGFAGFDVSSAKIPQLFWDFGSAPGTKNYTFFPMFNNAEQLADYSLNVLNNPNDAKLLAEQQYDFIDANFNIDTNVHQIEELYISTSIKQI